MRQRLAALYGQTHTFTAIFQTYAKSSTFSNVICLADVRMETENETLTDHVWIHRSKDMKRLELNAGDKVQFIARVGRYVKHEPTPHEPYAEYDYNLEKVRDMIIVWRKQPRRERS